MGEICTGAPPLVVLGFVFALLGAATNAASNVLQRKANREEPPELSLSPRLLWGLIHRKVWLAGLGATIASFLLQAAALSFGALAAVQPLIALELPLTLIGASLALGAVLHKREWVATAAMTAGLGVLIGFLHPSEVKHVHLDALGWSIGLAVAVAAVGALVVAGHLSQGAARAGLFGAASGLQFGVTAALMKGTMSIFPSGVVALATSWTPYAAIISGIAGMLLMQAALHAGRLVAAQPGITLLDPLVAILWGVVAFGEKTAGGAFLVAAGFGAAMMAAGAFGLSRSPLLEGTKGSDEQVGEEQGTSISGFSQ